MKTACLIICLISMASLCPDRALGKEPPTYYWRAGIGGVYMPEADWEDPYGNGSVSFDGGPGLSLAAGATPGVIPLRIELEWLYQASDISDITSDQPVIEPVDWASVYLSALMLNGYVDFKNETSITPYVMAGFGYGYYSIELEEDNAGSTTVPLFQAGAGIQYELNITSKGKCTAILDAGYRFVSSSDPEIDEAFGGVYKTEYTSHAIMLGVLFKARRTKNSPSGDID